MSLVYIHGLAVDEDSRRESAAQRRLFGTHVNSKLRRRFPYTEIEWFGLSRRPDINRLLGEAAGMGGTTEPSEYANFEDDLRERLAGNSRPSPKDVVDYLVLGAVDPKRSGDNDEAAELRAARLLKWLANEEPPPSISSTIQNWEEIRAHATSLCVPMEEDNSMAADFSPSQLAWERFQEFVCVKPSGSTAKKLRRTLAELAVRFTADSFTYVLTRNDIRGETIRSRIVEGIISAIQGRSEEYPLILVGHSFGGVILNDILSNPNPPHRFSSAIAKRPVLFITVGSQVALFNGVGLFSDIPDDINAAPNKPYLAKAWLNVYHVHDPLGYSIRPSTHTANTPGVTEIRWQGDDRTRSAHSGYLKSATLWNDLGQWIGSHT